MGHEFTGMAGAALVFAVLYSVILGWLVFHFATRRFSFNSRWTLLLLHVLIRVVSQALGVAFGVLVFDNIGIFIAYLVLSAEGYFSLTLASYLYLKDWQTYNLGSSWLISVFKSKKEGRRHAWKVATLQPAIMPWKYRVMDVMQSYLIPANTLIITGGSYLAGTRNSDKPQSKIDRSLLISKVLRGIGQGIFLAITVLFCLCVLKTMKDVRTRGDRVHGTLKLLFFVSICLCVRGTFGLLQSVVYRLSYTNPVNYDDRGFTVEFACLEYFLAVLAEFSSAWTLAMTYYSNNRRGQDAPDVPSDEVEAMEPSKAEKQQV